MKHWIYFIQERGKKDSGIKPSTAPVKIGRTGNMGRRLETLQSGNCRELKIIAKLGPFTRQQSVCEEIRLHRNLASFRIRNEWFSGQIFKKAKWLKEEL